MIHTRQSIRLTISGSPSIYVQESEFSVSGQASEIQIHKTNNEGIHLK